MLKGRVASGFCSPTLTWAQAVADSVKTSAALADLIRILVVYLSQSLCFTEDSPVFKAVGIRVILFCTEATRVVRCCAAFVRTPRLALKLPAAPEWNLIGAELDVNASG
jgi:hypothetical protein